MPFDPLLTLAWCKGGGEGGSQSMLHCKQGPEGARAAQTTEILHRRQRALAVTSQKRAPVVTTKKSDAAA